MGESSGEASTAPTPEPPKRPKKVGEQPVAEDELMGFLFPEGCVHWASAARLFLFANYGPLVKGNIVGGSFKNPRPLQPQELNDMIERAEREDILSVFMRGKSLSPQEEEDVIRMRAQELFASGQQRDHDAPCCANFCRCCSGCCLCSGSGR